MIKLVSAVMIKLNVTIELLVKNIAVIATLISIKYRKKGNNLLPFHPNIYLYPSSSLLLKTSDRKLKAAR
jgi:hypothetical protein